MTEQYLAASLQRCTGSYHVINDQDLFAIRVRVCAVKGKCRRDILKPLLPVHRSLGPAIARSPEQIGNDGYSRYFGNTPGNDLTLVISTLIQSFAVERHRYQHIAF